MNMEIQHEEITAKKITKNVWVASCVITKPIKAEVNMRGSTEEIAREKMRLLLNDQPYSHLD